MTKLAKISGRLKKLGPFGQQAAELRYASITLEQDDGSILTVSRVIVPAALNKLLEIGEPVSMYLANKGPWRFCFAVESNSGTGESYDGYRWFYVFNRSMMFLNLMAGIFLLGLPGLRVAGAGLLSFGVLFAWLGPPTIRAMHGYLTKNRSDPGSADQTKD